MKVSPLKKISRIKKKMKRRKRNIIEIQSQGGSIAKGKKKILSKKNIISGKKEISGKS